MRRVFLPLAGVAGLVLLGLAAAHADEAVDRLAVPGPIAFNGASYALSWTSHPSPAYYKQEYLPAGQTAEHFEQMILIDADAAGSVKGAAAATVTMLQKRQATDAFVNFAEIENPQTGEVIVDFILSAPDGDIVEWNAYRFAPLAMAGGKTGVVLFGISRRAYGDDIDDFLVALKAERTAEIAALAGAPLPAVKLAE